MKKLLIIPLLLLLVIPAACGTSSSEGAQDKVAPGYAGGSSGQGAPGMTYTMTATKTPAPTYGLPATTSAGGVSLPLPTGTSRMVVRNGNITLLVEDIGAALDRITALATSLQGYVVSSQSWRSDERYYGAISIRVPAESFEGAMHTLGSYAVEVVSQSSSSQDVTAEYVDLAARLKNLEATEQQLLAIMAQAVKVEDVLAVQRELTSVRGEIEQVKGRMQYLEQTSATSLIAVSLEQSKLGVKVSADRTVVKQGEDASFTSEVFGGFAPFGYEWDFGDGKTSTLANPTHRYDKAGTYTVSLKVSDDRGNSYTETRQDYVSVLASGWNVGGVAGGAWTALLTFGKGLLSVLIGLLVFSPVWLAIILVIWLIRRRTRRVPAR